MFPCDNCPLEKGKSAYCSSCPYYKAEVEIEENINDVNARLDLETSYKTKEEEVDYKKLNEEVREVLPSNYVYPPRIGEEITVEIVKIRKASNPRFNFKGNKTVVLPDDTKATQAVDLGFYIECDLKDGKILSVTNYSSFRKIFEANDIQDGDKVCIKHKAKGEWEVVKEGEVK